MKRVILVWYSVLCGIAINFDKGGFQYICPKFILIKCKYVIASLILSCRYGGSDFVVFDYINILIHFIYLLGLYDDGTELNW